MVVLFLLLLLLLQSSVTVGLYGDMSNWVSLIPGYFHPHPPIYSPQPKRTNQKMLCLAVGLHFGPYLSHFKKYRKAEYVQRRVCFVNIQTSLPGNVVFLFMFAWAKPSISYLFLRVFFFFEVVFIFEVDFILRSS